MPPKGWRKNADGQSPQNNKDSGSVSIDDLLFPRSTIQRLAKSVFKVNENDNVLMAKDSIIALQRSATVFVSYLAHNATNISHDQGRKTLNVQDILGALDRTEFSGFKPELEVKLQAYEKKLEEKRKQKQAMQKVNEGEDIQEVNTEEGSKRFKSNNGNDIQNDTVINEIEDTESDNNAQKSFHDEEEIVEDQSYSSEVHSPEHSSELDNKNFDEDNPEETPTNPIAFLSQEEHELGGIEEEGAQNDKDIEKEEHLSEYDNEDEKF